MLYEVITLLVFSFEAAAGGAEEGQGAVFRQGGNQQREVGAAGMLENTVDQFPAIGLADRITEGLGAVHPGVATFIGGKDAINLFRNLAPVYEGIGDAAPDQGLRQVLVSYNFV